MEQAGILVHVFYKVVEKKEKIHLINCERECLMVYLQNGFNIENDTFSAILGSIGILNCI